MSESERARQQAGAGGQPGVGGDPSMEDILASIRRILAEEEATPPPAAMPAPVPQAVNEAGGVLQLDASMLLPDPVPPPLPPLPQLPPMPPPEAVSAPRFEPLPHIPPVPAPPPPVAMPPPVAPQAAAPPPATPPPSAVPAASLISAEVAAATATSVGSLVRGLTEGRGTHTYSGGPTIEDIVRAEVRPLLKEWLDSNLPTLVERLVRVELERVLGRAAP
jgi:cell pole-organizing protein PopZ